MAPPCPPSLSTEDDWQKLYRQASDLIYPYFHLVGRDHADASSPEGQKNILDGIEKMNAVVSIVPGNWPAFWLLGKAYEALGQPEDEYRCFKRAFELNPDHVDVAREFMRACLQLGKGDEGVAVAWHACQIRQNDAGLLANLGLAMLIAGQVDEALTVTQQAVEFSPDDEITRNLLQGILDIKDGKADRPTKLPWSYDTIVS